MLEEDAAEPAGAAGAEAAGAPPLSGWVGGEGGPARRGPERAGGSGEAAGGRTTDREASPRRGVERGGSWDDEQRQAIAALGVDIEQLEDVIRYAFVKFDQNGDRQICFQEFCVACKMLGINIGHAGYAQIFNVLSRGDEFITPEDFGQQALQSVSQGFDVALTERYQNNGFAKAQYVLNEVGYQWERDERLPLPDRLGRALAKFWDSAESLSDLAEFLIGLVSLVVALRSIGDQLSCVPVDVSESVELELCNDKVDIGNLIPLLFLLRKSLSDVLKEVSESFVQDLDQDTAVAFATVFKPAGMKLEAFMSVRNQGAEWRTIPQGQTVSYSTMAAGDSLHLIVRGSMSLVAQGNVAGLSETVAVLQPGSFIGAAQFVETEDGLVSGRSSSFLRANEEVQLLEWTSKVKLQAFLRVHDSLQTEFTSAIVRSMAADMSQVTKQAKLFAFELPVVFRSFKTGLASTLGADRASIWIHNPATDSLWTWFVSDVGKVTYVSIPASTGLVGAAFSEEADLIIPDCYRDDRFNAEVDKKTGYRTQSMLCVPVFDEPAGPSEPARAIGVVQLINKMTGSPSTSARYASFTEADARQVFNVRWALRSMMKRLASRVAPRPSSSSSSLFGLTNADTPEFTSRSLFRPS